MLINMAPTLTKIRKSTCNCMNGTEIDSIFESRHLAFLLEAVSISEYTSQGCLINLW
jgi:hypothetical protein